MKEAGAYYAKAHFSELLSAVSLGEEYLITKHGRKVAWIIPFEAAETISTRESRLSSIRAIRKLRQGIKLGKGLTVKQMKNLGRA